ncbi:hypothetical protein FPV67DRAFT_1666129 [Lyophyllum atratum]|nr:hypothetical protein FPV67DRAFT_1666129 [Lyophyllum atratum]
MTEVRPASILTTHHCKTTATFIQRLHVQSDETNPAAPPYNLSLIEHLLIQLTSFHFTKYTCNGDMSTTTSLSNLPPIYEGCFDAASVPLSLDKLGDFLSIDLPSTAIYPKRQFRVRRHAIAHVLRWLKHCNPRYQNVDINQDELDRLPLSAVLPNIGSYAIDDAVDDAPLCLLRLSVVELLLVTRKFFTATVYKCSRDTGITAVSKLLPEKYGGRVDFNSLPLSLHDLHDFISLEPSADYPDDFLMIRRHYVREALLWLKGNHACYHLIKISAINVDILPLYGSLENLEDFVFDVTCSRQIPLGCLTSDAPLLSNVVNSVAFADCFPLFFPGGKGPFTSTSIHAPAHLAEWTLNKGGVAAFSLFPGYLTLLNWWLEIYWRENEVPTYMRQLERKRFGLVDIWCNLGSTENHILAMRQYTAMMDARSARYT